MHQIRFDAVEVRDDEVMLSGRFWSARIQLVDGGIWRMHFFSRLEDADKSSWVVQASREPFRTSQHTGVLLLEGKGCPSLEIQLDPLRVLWGGAGTKELLSITSMSVRRTRALGDFRSMKELATGQGDPLVEEVDGLPFAGGISMTISDPPARRYYGLGERTGFLDKRGRMWTNWATDQSRHVPSADPLYVACPFVMALERGVAAGLYLDETWRSVFDLSASEPERSVIHADGPTFDAYLIPGPSPREVIERFTALVGRAPMPPLWAFGYHQCRWSYPNQDAALALAREFDSREIPLEALWLDIDYMDGYKVFSFSPGRFPDPVKLTAALAAKGIKTVAIVDPGVKQEAGYGVYESGLARDAYVKDRRENLLVGEVWPSPAVWPDFTREDVRGWWGQQCSFYSERGLAGLWLDMNEPAAFGTEDKSLPVGARHGRRWHAEVHNIYGQMMCMATREALVQQRPGKRPFVLTRSGFAGVQRYAWVWTGDNASYWEHLEMSLPMLMNMGMSGIPFVGADVGGFSEDASAELLVRWLWTAALYPFMRNHAGKGTRRQEPWSFGEPFTHHAREAISFRYQLLPLLYSLAREACETGLPLLRPLVLEHPDDPEVEGISDQVLLGRDLLAAPVLRPGQVRRLVYLPEGTWYDFWTGERYEGRAWIVARAMIDRLPMFQRAGSVIPLCPPALRTGTARWGELTLRVAPDARIAGRFYEDDGDGDESCGAWTEVVGRVVGDRFEIELPEAAVARKRLRVEVAGRPVAAEASGPGRATSRGFELELANGRGWARW